jgi:hypothetical protein
MLQELLLLVLFVLALAPAATSVAVLPVGAEQLSLDVVPVLEQLDKDLRGAVGREPGIALQDPAVTKSQVIGARSLGVSCGPEDTACLAKLCALAGVDRVVQVLARFSDDGTIGLKLITVESGGSSAVTEDVLPADEAARPAAIAALAKRAQVVTRPAAAAIPPTPAATPTPTPTPVDPPPAAAEAPAPSLFLAGVAVAATGGAIALGSAIGAFALDLSLAEPEAFSAREPKMLAGRALVLVAGASTVVAAAGAALIVVASTQE